MTPTTEKPTTNYGRHLRTSLDIHAMNCLSELETFKHSADGKLNTIRIHMLNFLDGMREVEKEYLAPLTK